MCVVQILISLFPHGQLTDHLPLVGEFGGGGGGGLMWGLNASFALRLWPITLHFSLGPFTISFCNTWSSNMLLDV